MDQQTKRAVATALDRAIAKVAKDEFRRLRSGLSRIEVAQEVEAALNSLYGLRRGDIPEYDAWDALFYVTWYQPSQVNLAYSIITEMQNKGFALDEKLHIVDFGCGALAMQFAVALAIADALEQGHSVSEIGIELIDGSGHMVRLGKKVWRQFKIEVNKDSSLSHLAEACETIKYRRNTPSSVKRQKWADACWVSAIHAVYEENKVAVKQELDILVNDLNPDVCFTTTNDMGGHGQSLLSALWDTDNNRYHDWAWNKQPRLQFNSRLTSITDWRANLHGRLSPISPITKIFNYRTGLRDYPIRDYLTNSVTWQWRDAAILVHIKRE